MKPGDSLDGRYTIVQRLGAGGMGEVYQATHDFLGTPRVIKVVHPQISGSEDAQDRFIREARAATKVQHPNVATLHDFATLPDGAHYMVWEFIDGENLAQRLRTRGTLPARQAVRIAVQALHGLEAIHRAGIVHRDISPENLMITSDDEVKIIDLGVAKVEDSTAVSQTRTGIFVGKLRYASPEQLGFMPEGEKIDARADIYAMAMVIVELLTGRPPYEAKSPHEYFLLHAREAQKKTVELPAQIAGSTVLAQTLEKALAHDRNARFGTAREFADALEAIVATLQDQDAVATVLVPGPSLLNTTARDSVVRDTDSEETPPAPTLRTPMPEMSARSTLQTPMPQAFAALPAQRRINPALLVGIAAISVLIIGGAALWPRINTRAPLVTADSSNATATAQQAAAALPASGAATPAQSSLTVSPLVASTAEPSLQVTPLSAPAVTPPPAMQQPVAQGPVAPTRRVESKPVESSRASKDAEPAPPRVSVPLYVDGGDDDATNERALEILRSELQGTRVVALRAGGMQVELVNALKEHFPEMKFEAYGDVVIRFEGTMDRVGRGRKKRYATATVLKNDRVVFRYELPEEIFRVGMHPPEAFARVFAHAIE